MDHRAQVMSWVRELFTGVQVRTVVDNTRKYYQLLNLATHPEFQMSPALTEVLFHRCGIGRVDHVTPAVVRAEIADLRRRDIPYFTLRTDRTEVFDSRGRAIANPLAMTPLEHVEAAIAHMSPARRELNAQIICSTYVGKVDQRLDRPGWDQCTPSARGTAGREDMDLVRGIADHYLQQAVPGDGDGPTEWIGSTLSNTAQAHPWRFRQLGDGLYAGRSGLALFLSAAGARFRDERYLDCAERFLLPRAHELLADPAERRRTVVGGMGDGYPGVAYALINGGRLAGRPEWVDRGLELWGLVAADVPALTTTDQLMGSAGILTASCRLLGDGTIPQDAVPGVRRAADEAFQHLVGAPSPGPAAAAGRTYSGYAHGEAGLIAALTLDAQHRPEAKRLVRGIQDGYAARFERSSLPWAISDDTPDRRAHGWCHGAPGILVAELVRQEDGGQDRHEIIEALHRIVLAECLDLNFSLCHGDIGNLAILQRSATFLGDAETQATIKQRLSALVTQILPRRLTARNAKTLLNDAFMVGLPGVGYGLLQLEADGVLPDPFTYGIPR
jgi:lantibiotic modifying enzyme